MLDAIAAALGRSNVGPTQASYADAVRPQRCPECRGRGQIELLVRRVPCKRCGGVGEIRTDIADLPLRHVHLIPASIRFSLHRSGLRTLREVKQLKRDEIQSRAHLSDAAMETIEKLLTA
jgi:RecJ-like exonuclease